MDAEKETLAVYEKLSELGFTDILIEWNQEKDASLGVNNFHIKLKATKKINHDKITTT